MSGKSLQRHQEIEEHKLEILGEVITLPFHLHMTDSDEMDLLYHKVSDAKYHFTLYYYPDDLRMLYLYDFAVEPEYQHKGLGSQIIKSLIHTSATEFDSIFLWCADDWHVAYYQRFGFEVFDEFTIDDEPYKNMMLVLHKQEK